MRTATVVPLRPPRYMAELGERLLAAGYRIIPIKPASKEPAIGGWPKVEADATLVRHWVDTFPDAGIGILAAHTPAIDIDTLDAGMADEMTRFVWFELGLGAPHRVGRAPKVLLVCRTDAPFRKMMSPVFTDLEGREHRTEILGDGQQWVWAGVHPLTGKPYRSPVALHEMPVAELPLLTVEIARQVIDRFCQLAEARGWRQVGDEPAPAERPDWPRKRARIEHALAAIPEDARSDHDMWLHVGMGLHREGAPFEVWDEWSAPAANYNEKKSTEYTWKSFTRTTGNLCNAETIYRYARKFGWDPEAAPKEEPRGKLALIDPSRFQGVAIPERRWLVPEWIPMARATGLYGGGGEGKTLLAQMLATACALGQPWLGLPVTQCRSLLLFCEDDLDEMLQRQAAINRHFGCDFADLGAMRWEPRLGEDNTLMSFTGGRPERTELFDQVLAGAKQFGAKLVFTDTVADVFSGNENDRTQVRAFVQQTLAYMAREIDGAVVAPAHPSRAGIRDGTGESGSTAWQGTFRSRLYLSTPQGDEGTPIDPDLRVLAKMKINASRRDAIELRWRDGVLVPTMPPIEDSGSVERRTCEAVFLSLLDNVTSQGRRVSARSRASNYAPKVFALHPDRERFTRKDFERAMETLLARGLLMISQQKDETRRLRDCVMRTDFEGVLPVAPGYP